MVGDRNLQILYVSIALKNIWQIGSHVQDILNIVLFQRLKVLAVAGVAEKKALFDLNRLNVDRLLEIVRCTCAFAVRVGAAAAGRVRERDRDAERPQSHQLLGTSRLQVSVDDFILAPLRKRLPKVGIAAFKTHHTAAILLKFSVQHVDGSVIRRVIVARIDHHIVAIVVQHEGTFLVAGKDSLLQVAALDSRGDVYLASGESAQHYAGNAKVNRRTDVTLGELIRAAAVEDDKILVRFPQLAVQLLTRDDLYIVVRHLAEPENSRRLQPELRCTQNHGQLFLLTSRLSYRDTPENTLDGYLDRRGVI